MELAATMAIKIEASANGKDRSDMGNGVGSRVTPPSDFVASVMRMCSDEPPFEIIGQAHAIARNDAVAFQPLDLRLNGRARQAVCVLAGQPASVRFHSITPGGHDPSRSSSYCLIQASVCPKSLVELVILALGFNRWRLNKKTIKIGRQRRFKCEVWLWWAQARSDRRLQDCWPIQGTTRSPWRTGAPSSSRRSKSTTPSPLPDSTFPMATP